MYKYIYNTAHVPIWFLLSHHYLQFGRHGYVYITWGAHLWFQSSLAVVPLRTLAKKFSSVATWFKDKNSLFTSSFHWPFEIIQQSCPYETSMLTKYIIKELVHAFSWHIKISWRNLFKEVTHGKWWGDLLRKVTSLIQVPQIRRIIKMIQNTTLCHIFYSFHRRAQVLKWEGFFSSCRKSPFNVYWACVRYIRKFTDRAHHVWSWFAACLCS